MAVAPLAMAQDPLYQYTGALSENEGRYLVGLGDVNGDGLGDFVSVVKDQIQHMEARSGANGAVLWSKNLSDLPGGGWVTTAAAVTGDLDGDGVLDFVLGSMETWSTGVNAGRVRTFSGATGAKLWDVAGEVSNLFFGTSVAGMDDVDFDGVEDVAVGAWSDQPPNPMQGNVGSVRVLSGVDGHEIYRIYGPAYASSGPGGSGIGGTLGRLGDLDGDGLDDLGVGSYFGTADTDDGEVKSPVWIVSGADGSLIVELPLPEYTWPLTPAFASTNDLTGDRVAEFVAGFPHSAVPETGGGGVAILFDGTTKVPLAEWKGEVPLEFFGGSIVVPGDVDGDGHADVLVGIRQTGAPVNPPYGVVRLFSGRTHEELFELLPDPQSPTNLSGFFGRALAPLGDVNGDGAPDFVLGQGWSDGIQINPGQVRAYSTRPLTLWTKAPYVSAAGGVQRLNIELGPEHGGEIYLTLGSATGIEPAVPLGGLALPLVPDTYTTWVLASGGGPMGGDFVGLLDAQGHALVKVTVPPLTGPLASLVGSVLWHAALSLDPIGAPSATTNAVPLTLVP
ncbi:MAG TPA: VCBS repeat-containing protein [Planctomycetota bacterium]|nr:VCBS repeat-containing protein [Planctomycetota bacterium]